MTISRNLSILADGVSASGVLDVASGGTGVTVSSGASSVMLRDTNQNVAINRLNQANTNTAAAGGVTTLTAASAYSQTLTGTGAQTYRMPDATTLSTGVAFIFNNNATGTLTLQDSASGAIGTITAGGAVELICVSTATVAGTWDYHGFLPENVTWGTNALAMGSTVVTGGTWQGGTIASAYGGTGLTTFTAANNALYSTSASALVAGTLPAAAGGTGQSSYAVGDVLYASTTTALSKLADVATGNALISGGVGVAPSYGKIGLTTHVSGTLPVGNGGTGVATLTSNGVLYGNGTSAAGITAAGTTGQVLIATTSGAPSWGSVPTTAAVTSITFGTTGLTPATATTGAVTVAGTLAVANGGTGVTTSTGSGSNVLSTSPTLVSPALGTPTALVGTNITGTASGLSIGGNAATATLAANTSSISSATGGAYTWTAANFFQSNSNTGTTTGGTPLQAYSTSSLGAIMSFHRAGVYAVNMGLDSDNVFRIGGWSAPANLLQMTMGGALTMASSVTATSFSGAGTGLTGTASSLSIGGNAATATTAANGGVTSIVAGTNVTISGATGAVTINATAGTATAVTLPSTNPFVQNATTLSANLTISTNNAMAAGPITINTGVTLTVSTGSRVVIV